MSSPAIQAEGLGKIYRIGRAEKAPDTLGGTLASWVGSPLKNLKNLRALTRFSDGSGEDTVWALRDVSFEVPSGEILGVIGRNGAGKTTLLKILSRITEPTCGEAIIHGRVSSLLEVGTGFHAELTGRENIYLNGTILGMSKAEIDEKLSRIIDFSGVERFIDTPVKRYSSGMKVRLAFSVAAHLDPEILLIDEVLAVGDIEFQNKCLGKMKDVASSGRTVVFVSHQLGVVKSLCTSVMVLDEGTITFRGDLESGIRSYSRSFEEPETVAIGGGHRWADVTVNSARGTCHMHSGDPLEIAASIDVGPEASGGQLIVIITNAEGHQVVHDHHVVGDLRQSLHDVRVRLPGLWLAPGFYSLDLKMHVIGGDPAGRKISAPAFVLDIEGDHQKTGKKTTILAPESEWTFEPSQPE